MHRLTLALTFASTFAFALTACTFETGGLGTDGGTGSSGTTAVDTTSATTSSTSTAATETGTGSATGTTTTATTEPTTGVSATATTSTTTDGTTTIGPPSCGDGMIDPGEECDNGAMNGNDQVCKADCTNNVCGDGFVGPGEGCDDGNANDGDGCSAACVGEMCGNGNTDPGEECDDGNTKQDDGCTNACKLPACGDMIVQMGEACDEGGQTASCDADCSAVVCGDGVLNEAAGEVCDDGNTNNTDECPKCQLAACGDTFVQAGQEQCDDGNTMDGDGCSSTCVVEGLRVFVTSGVFDGNFGGLTGADAKCQEIATGAGLGGTWMAWLSDDTDGPAARFTTKGGQPYVRLDGKIVANTWADLLDGSIANAINIDESKANGGGTNFVWTNTKTTGTPTTTDKVCKSWNDGTGGSNRGARGNRTQTGQKWTEDADEKCDQKYHLYCFEQ